MIFDLDGVLIDSEPLHLRATQEVLAAHGVRLAAEDYYSTYLVLPDREVLGRLLPGPADRLAAALAAKTRRYRELVATGVPAFPDGLGLLARTLGWAVALATGSVRAEAELALGALGIRERFQAVVAAEDCRRGKPDPEPYRRAAAALGLPPERCVAIEDAPGGIRAARGAGMRCVAVTHTCGRERLGEADLVVDDLETLDLEALLGGAGPRDG